MLRSADIPRALLSVSLSLSLSPCLRDERYRSKHLVRFSIDWSLGMASLLFHAPVIVKALALHNSEIWAEVCNVIWMEYVRCGWILLFLHSNFALYVYEKKNLTFPLMKYVRGGFCVCCRSSLGMRTNLRAECIETAAGAVGHSLINLCNSPWMRSSNLQHTESLI